MAVDRRATQLVSNPRTTRLVSMRGGKPHLAGTFQAASGDWFESLEVAGFEWNMQGSRGAALSKAVGIGQGVKRLERYRFCYAPSSRGYNKNIPCPWAAALRLRRGNIVLETLEEEPKEMLEEVPDRMP